MIVLDTSILSRAFRRRTPADLTVRSREFGAAEPPETVTLRRLISENHPLVVPGVVLQEFLSGTWSVPQFRELQEALSGFPVELATHADHLRAATISRECRAAGLAPGTMDCLVAAHALRRGRSLFTSDQDFGGIAAVTRLRLFRP